ncbi:MAG: cation diffusion facilitator family transporter [Alphaproteobacteria bacterium]|nr:cation diffusion facilitator family transporter [Alphaproteobacteria bacterium]
MTIVKDQEKIRKDKLRQQATYVSCAVAFTLILAKAVAFLLTDSVAMLSSLLDSTLDLLASAVAMFSIMHALMPPDHDHRFGHGKIEALASLAQAAFIICSSFMLCYAAIGRFSNPQEVQHSSVGYAVMIFSIIATIGLLRFQRHVIIQTDSMAVSADMLHYTGDLMSNAAVIASLFLQQLTGLLWFDPVFAIGIAISLIYSAWQIASGAVSVLLDRELSEEERNKIAAIVLAQPEVRGVHDIRTRSDSHKAFIEIHMELDPLMSLKDAHEIAEKSMDDISKEFANADTIVHFDPAGMPETRLDNEINERKKSD